jgi:ankyrin repeat protein
VYTLLEHKPKADLEYVMSHNKETPLFTAVRNRHLDIVKVLVKFRCNIDAGNHTLPYSTLLFLCS